MQIFRASKLIYISKPVKGLESKVKKFHKYGDSELNSVVAKIIFTLAKTSKKLWNASFIILLFVLLLQ